MLRKFVSLVMLVLLVLAGFWVYKTHENVKRVMAYEPEVKKQLEAQGLSGDTSLALAIIYTETKGKSTDVMQSSESLTGQKDSISDKTVSIQQGLANLSAVLTYAESKKVDVLAGVQAYNYGQAYVDYIAKNGGKNTIELSKEYSKNVVAPSLGNTTGKTYYHITFDSLRYNGGKLYVNGGNIFYAEEVQFHMFLLKIFNW